MVNKIFNDYLAKPFVNYLSEPFFNIIEPLPSLIDNFARSQIDPKKVAEWDAQRPEREALWKTVSNRIQLQSTVILDTNKMWNSFIEIWNPFIDMIEPLPSVIND